MHSVGGTFGQMYDSLTAGPSGPPPKPRKERKLSLLLRRTIEPAHCAGVESLALSPNGGTLFTASRDATIRSWSAEGSDCGQWRASFEGHSNWVNDVVTVDGALVSCSSDCTISVWKANAGGVAKSEATLYSHTDYVTRLAAAQEVPIVVSGGLRGQVMLWDVTQTVRSLQQGQHFRSIDQSSPFGSVYALDISADGKLVAVGSPGGIIRISDARSASKSFKLRGHMDNIRSLVLNEEGSLALSASSDHTIKLWDLGQQRCVHTFAVHTDSVWTLWAPGDFSLIYSGGRDNCVYRTHVASRSTELLFQEQAPINKLQMSGDGRRLWCATTSSSVRGWDVPPPDWGGGGGGGHHAPTSPRTPGRMCGRVFHACPSPQVRQRQRFSIGPSPEPSESSVQVEIRGVPPLVRFATLADRRHVLTQDSQGQVALWDLACGAIVEQYGKVDMAAKERDLFRPDSIAPWFTADVKLGSLAVHLEPPSCFAAEIYATDLGREDSPDDLKLNFGEHLLKAALEKWVSGLAASFLSSGPANGVGPAELAAAASSFQLHDGVAPLVMGTLLPEGGVGSTSNRPWTKAANEFDGTERVGEVIPKWVAEAVLNHRFPVPVELKCAFLLIPAESRLNAPRILKMTKVASYVIGKLQEEGLAFHPHRLFYEPAWQAQLEEQRRAANGNAGSSEVSELEFICNGQAVPFDLSLAAVRSFMWRRSDTLTINFRVFDPSKPAPLPTIKPP